MRCLGTSRVFEFAVVAAFLPALGWLALVYARDRYEHEPKWLVLRVFIVSAIVGPLLAGTIETLVTVPLLGTGLVGWILAVGLVEETVKLVPVWLLVRRNRNLNEPVDGMVYMVAAGLGFAAVETTLFIAGAGADSAVVAVLRAVLTAPMHFLEAGIVGYFFAATVLGGKPRSYVLRGLGLAAVLHGSFDYSLLSNSIGVAVLLLVISAGIFIYLFRRALALSPFRTAQITTGLSLPVPPPAVAPTPVGGGDHSVRALLHTAPAGTETEIARTLGSMPDSVAGLKKEFNPGFLLVAYGRGDHESARVRVQSLQQFASALAAQAGATSADALRQFAQTTGLQLGEHSFNPATSLVYVLAIISTAQGPKYAAVWAAPKAAWIFSVLADTGELRSTLIDAFATAARPQATAASPAQPAASEVLQAGGAVAAPTGSPSV